jgi:hypothetical protein
VRKRCVQLREILVAVRFRMFEVGGPGKSPVRRMFGLYELRQVRLREILVRHFERGN